MNQALNYLRVLPMLLLLLYGSRAQSQTNLPKPIRFKSGFPAIKPVLQNIDPITARLNRASQPNQAWYFLQFQKIPSQAKRTQLQHRGIELVEYIPDNSFLCRVKGKWSAGALADVGITGSLPFDPIYKRAPKLDPETKNGRYHLLLAPGTNNDLLIKAGKFRKISARLLEAELVADEVEKLLQEPDLLYLMPAPDLKVLNENSTDLLQADRVQHGWEGQTALDGKGVVMGIGDNGLPYHIDNRFNEEGQSYLGARHATYVAAIMAGTGTKDPRYKGFAPGATLLVDYFDNILYRAPEYYQSKGMVITNNSYGAGSTCTPVSGQYSVYAGQIDQQLLDLPELMHVFALGNSGFNTCAPFPMGYKTVDNSYQAAKNIISVGATDGDGAYVPNFSRGPSMDGRIKPELAGMGAYVKSAAEGNGYIADIGTSAASPQVAGSLALLYERYRQINDGKNPRADLMKAVLCNTATDIGRKGVDFSYGFGLANPADAIDLVNRKQYFTGAVDQDAETSFTINLSKPVSRLRIMLYWADHPSSYYTSKNLVNDLDITVVYPDGSIHDPLVLDTSSAGVETLAKEGKDHINNIEQVYADDAAPGIYTVKVKGYAVPFGPQPFQLVYYYADPEMKLLQPSGGESWKPSESHRIRWQFPGHETEFFQFDFSADGGGSWTNIGSGSDPLEKEEWIIPDTSTTRARIRVTHIASGQQMLSPEFNILPEIVFSATSPCAQTMNLKWKKPAGIDSAVVFLYDSGLMKEKWIGSDSIIRFDNLPRNINQWISFAPVANGKQGERSRGIPLMPAVNACPLLGAAGDIGLLSISLPPTGREATTTAPTDSFPIVIRLINSSNTSFIDSLYINVKIGGEPVSRQGFALRLAAGQQVNLATASKLFPVPGSTTPVQVILDPAGDPNPANNRKDSSWRYLTNPTITLPFSNDFQSTADTVYRRPGYIGIEGADRWDFSSSSTSLQLRTGESAAGKGLVVNSRIAGQQYQLTGTFNLSDYQTTDNISLNLYLPEFDLATINCAVRGSDTVGWLTVPNSVLQRFAGLNIPVSSILTTVGQRFSTSTQVRLNYGNATLKETIQPIAKLEWLQQRVDLSVDEASVEKANFLDRDSIAVSITIKNQYRQPVANLPFGLNIGGQTIFTSNIETIPGFGTIVKSVKAPLTGLPSGNLQLSSWVGHPEDDFKRNDTLALPISIYRKIQSFPYREGFEQGAGDWFSSGLYVLNDQLDPSNPGFKAANGKSYWQAQSILNMIDGPYQLLEGYLNGPVFDLSGLQKPYLSLSVNKQLCDGKDSVILEISADTGITWTRYDIKQGAINFYDSASNTAWLGICDTAYWQVVSIPLPQSNQPLSVRILSYPRLDHFAETLPKLSAGLLVDDLHVYDLLFPIYAEKQAAEQPSITKADGWSHLLQNSQVWAAFAEPPANISGDLLPSRQLPIENGGWFNGQPVFPKVWVLGKTAASDKIRLYFTHADWLEWQASLSCDTCTSHRSAYDLSVFRYAGPAGSLDASEANNLEGFITTWEPDSFDLVPYGAGYYAEIPSAAYGEFYLGYSETAANRLQFSATKQEGADAVILSWSLTQTNGVIGYEIERAARNSGVAPTFTMIGQLPQDGTVTSYRFRDQKMALPGSYYYRIKLLYADGSVRYTSIQTISFDANIDASIYPNPYNGGECKLLLKNMEGRKVGIQLFDLNGRHYWSQKLEPQSRQRIVDLSAAVKRLPAGVYAIKLTVDGQKMTYRLVVSGK